MTELVSNRLKTDTEERKRVGKAPSHSLPLVHLPCIPHVSTQLHNLPNSSPKTNHPSIHPTQPRQPTSPNRKKTLKTPVQNLISLCRKTNYIRKETYPGLKWSIPLPRRSPGGDGGGGAGADASVGRAEGMRGGREWCGRVSFGTLMRKHKHKR